MSRPWRQEDVDQHYTRFSTTIRDEETLEEMVAPVIRRFAEAGHRTAIVTEKQGEEYVFHCLAVHLLKGEIPRAVSQQVEAKTLDGLKVASVRDSEMEPLGISFGKPRF
ncbi:MAG: hypothetical protein ACAI44_16255 [Candidatus Sericytochromatia bacterium]